jgi:hypothetical protein
MTIVVTFFRVVEFRSKEDAEKAIKEYNGQDFHGRPLQVREVSIIYSELSKYIKIWTERLIFFEVMY